MEIRDLKDPQEVYNLICERHQIQFGKPIDLMMLRMVIQNELYSRLEKLVREQAFHLDAASLNKLSDISNFAQITTKEEEYKALQAQCAAQCNLHRPPAPGPNVIPIGSKSGKKKRR